MTRKEVVDGTSLQTLLARLPLSLYDVIIGGPLPAVKPDCPPDKLFK